MSLISLLLLGGSVIITIFLHAYLSYRRNLRAMAYIPAIKTIVASTRPIVQVLPYGKLPFVDWRLSIGPNFWIWKGHRVFKKYSQDILALVSLDFGSPGIAVADADAIQEILGNKSRYGKPIELYGVLDLFGHNVLTTENEEWRMHRKIAAPSFTENNNRMVCEETGFILQGLFDLWNGKEVVEYEDVTSITVPLALMVICRAGFGVRVSWVDDAPPPGHRLTFKRAIEVVSSDLMIKALLPNFAMPLTPRTSRIQNGFTELYRYITEMINDRVKSYRDFNDLFSNLMAVNENDDENFKLTDQELIGNIFIFLIAGHETTAHTLALVIGLLALYPKVQAKLYKHVCEVVAEPSGAPTYAETSSLTYATAVFYEALRLYPTVTAIPKLSLVDTTLQTRNSKGESVTVPIPQGTFIFISTPGLHHNPRYWKDPEEFNPDRFLGDWPKNAFVPFSTGARSCVGRRFAEVEAITALSILVKNYHIEIKPDALIAGESFTQLRSRILAVHSILTLTPKAIPIRFTRR